ncbi:site-specific DNA-methyltransferase [Helicobacter pylori]|nr:site-specific DNA-methyltransferase [Helicobacter pylori]
MLIKEKVIKLAQTLEINMIIGGPPCQGFSNKGKNLGLKDPRNFLFLEYIEIVRALKPEIFIIENVKNLISCAKGYFLEENGFVVKDFIQWVKTNPMPRNIHRRYVQDTEFALWAVKKKAKWVFNKPKNEKYLRPLILKSPVVSGIERVKHPTQKSLALMEKIISIHTNPNDIVLDPFMGSGTTGLACKRLERNFIGIESEKEYFQIAKKRLNLF